jgi:hypothetical protein
VIIVSGGLYGCDLRYVGLGEGAEERTGDFSELVVLEGEQLTSISNSDGRA